MKAQPVLMLFNPSHDDGGVERVLVNLANGFIARHFEVWLITCCKNGAYLDHLDQRVFHCIMPESLSVEQASAWLAETIEKLPAVYLLTAKDGDETTALNARALLQKRTDYREGQLRLATMVGTPLLVREQQEYPLTWRFRQIVRRYRGARHYAGFDAVIAISEGVRQDFMQYAGVSGTRVHRVCNPVFDAGLFEAAAQTVQHPWLDHPGSPVIMALGRMSKVKDFATLLRAFALLRKQSVCRLLIIGNGRQHGRLQSLAKALGIADDVDMPGFIALPYAFIARADLLVVSSRREGGPNVLIEAMALGVPVVSTDCPYGPREILAQGQFGALVPVGDAEALAIAMHETLSHPLPRLKLQQAAAPYACDAACEAWLRALELSAT